MSANADEITLFRYVGDDEYSVRYGDVSQNGFYDHVALEGRDKYSVFLGGNHGRTSVVKNGSVRPTLILIKDSYSHSLAPFLALHFNLELIDPRYFSDSLHTLLSDINAEKLVLFCGIDTLATADLRIVGRGE